MTLYANELAEVCREIEAALIGQPVQKITQPDDHTLLFGFPTGWLCVVVHPRFGRLHLVGKPVGTGEAAPAFCMLLRKHLQSARLTGVEVAAGDRACALHFERRADAHACTLLLFLYGRSAQLVLVDDADHNVLGELGAKARVPRNALIAPAAIAVAPTSPPVSATPATSETVATSETPAKPASAAPSRFSAPFSPAIAEFYRAAEANADAQGARSEIEQLLLGERKRLARLIAALQLDLARADRIDAEKKWADLIFANLRVVLRGAKSVTLPDSFTDNSPLEIPLDPALSATQNAERFYKNVRRFGRARTQTAARLAKADGALSSVNELLTALPTLDESALFAKRDAVFAQFASSRGQLSSSAARQAIGVTRGTPNKSGALRKSGGLTKRGGLQPVSLPYHEYFSQKGAPIWVGRGAARNDELTFKVARGADLWLHARDVPGAHVVVPLGQSQSLDPELLIDAATLAAHHSNARDELQVDVTYTLRKNVRRVPKSRAGQVTLSDGKTVRVRIEPDRLARLLASKK